MNSDALIDTKLPKSKDFLGNTKFLKIRSDIICTGLDMAIEIKRNVKTLILMYQTVGKMPNKTRLHDIVRSIEMLKAIELEFRKKKYLIN